MSEYRSSGRPAPRNYDNYPRSANGAPRSQGSRPPQNRRPAPQGSRPPQGRRPAPRRKKKGVQPRFFIILAVLLIVAVAAVVLLSGGSSNDPKQPKATPTARPQTNQSNVTISSSAPSATDVPSMTNTGAYTPLAEMLADEDSDLAGLSAEQMVKVSDLSLNTALPQEWVNILLLGTDNRSLTESSRTDTMIICSINKNTGEVKLTNIMRDLAVFYDELPAELNPDRAYRINAAHYFGGPDYAMKTVNECFGLNIQNYVSVNFYGFRAIVDALGGIEVDISEAEMNEINRLQVQQAYQGFLQGVDNKDETDHLLEQYGEDIHLNGRQSLAYARIRKIDNDYVRQERQRTVLKKLMQKLSGKNALELISLADQLSKYVSTNMSIDEIITIASGVLKNTELDFESFRLPVSNSYVQETRNNDSMFYDCDWAKNSLQLYNFIYE